MQCCICSKWVHLRCSLLSFSRFDSMHISRLKLFSLLTPFSCRSHTYQHCVVLFRHLQFVYSHCSTWSIWPPLLMLRTRLTLVFKPLTYLPPTCISSLCTLPILLMFLVVFLYLLLLRPFLTRSGFFNGMPEIFEPKALNYYTLSRLTKWILSVHRNPIFTHFPLFGSLHSLLCDLIALTTAVTFFSLDDTLASAIIFVR